MKVKENKENSLKNRTLQKIKWKKRTVYDFKQYERNVLKTRIQKGRKEKAERLVKLIAKWVY